MPCKITAIAPLVGPVDPSFRALSDALISVRRYTSNKDFLLWQLNACRVLVEVGGAKPDTPNNANFCALHMAAYGYASTLNSTPYNSQTLHPIPTSHRMYWMLLESQLPHKIVNLLFTITN